MKQKKLDRRIQRTRQLLQDALIALILEKGYDKITVQNLIDRANVGRSTFYTHYLDKEDLMASTLDKLREELGMHMTYERDTGDGEAEGEGETFLPSLTLLRHVQKQHHLYKALIGGKGIDIVVKALNEALISHALDQLKEQTAAHSATEPIVPPLVIATYLAGSLHTLMTWWLDNDMPYSPEQMNVMFRQLTIPGVEAVLGKRSGHEEPP